MTTRPVDDEKFKTISWHPEALSYAHSFGLTQEDCEKIVLSRSRPILDPRSNEVGHLIVRYRAGDVTVVVGHREKEHPVIMSVKVNTGFKGFAGSRSGSSGSGSTLPKTMRELHKRILADGFKIVHGGSHLRVEDDEGTLIASLSSTPSEYRTIANTWKYYQRARIEYQNTKKESNGEHRD